MRFFFPFLLLIFSIGLLPSCSTDFEVNEEWKEIIVVYGLLDRDSSVQYIRVNKAFLNDNRSALQVAQENDSLYLDSAIVTLQQIRAGNVVGETRLQKILMENKEPGIFSFPSQYLYRTPANFRIDPASHYKIVAENPKTGVKADASTSIVEKATFPFIGPIGGTSAYRLVPDQLSNITWTPGANARFYDVTFNISYVEKHSITGDSAEKLLVWPLSRYTLTPALRNSTPMLQNIRGEDFYKFMAQHIPADIRMRRRLTNIEFVLEGGGQEVYNYIVVNQPSTGIVQKRPEYTNINNGYGIFSSRTVQKHHLILDKGIFQILRESEITAHLNFE